MRRAILILSLIMLASCSRPVSDEMFVRTGERDIHGRYSFVVDMSDSLSRYGIGIVVMMDSDDRTFKDFSALPLTIDWVSPDKDVYSETVSIGRKYLKDSTYYTKTLEAAYRKGLVPVRYGNWRLRVNIPETIVEKYNVTGVGISLERE